MSDDGKKDKKLDLNELQKELEALLGSGSVEDKMTLLDRAIQDETKVIAHDKWKNYTKDTIGISEQINDMVQRLNEPGVYDTLKKKRNADFTDAGARSKQMVLHGDGTSSVVININHEIALWVVEGKNNTEKSISIGIEKIDASNKIKNFPELKALEKINVLGNIKPVFDQLVPMAKPQVKVEPVIEKIKEIEKREEKLPWEINKTSEKKSRIEIGKRSAEDNANLKSSAPKQHKPK